MELPTGLHPCGQKQSFPAGRGVPAVRMKFLRRLACAALSLCLVLAALRLWKLSAEPGAHWTPDYPRTGLSEIIQKPKPEPADYLLLLRQTGLAPSAVDELYRQGRQASLSDFQEAFFSRPAIRCEANSPISSEEHTVDALGNPVSGTRLAFLEDGDILITPCSHTFGWRNGHAALVVDAAQGLTLESVVLGTDSCIQHVSKWETYPAVLVFRLRGASAEKRAEIAKAAWEGLEGIPYGFTVGLFSPKHPEQVTETHCAHLVWEACRAFGYDIDGDGGLIVTPNDLSRSPLLELKQAYGVNPETLW